MIQLQSAFVSWLIEGDSANYGRQNLWKTICTIFNPI